MTQTAEQIRRTGAYRVTLFFVLLGLLFLFFVLSIAIGSVSIPLDEVFNILIGQPGPNRGWLTIVSEIRLPQAFTAMIAGAALSTGGLMMQALFRNPLADPSILGVSSGASLGVALVALAAGWLGGASLLSAGLIGEITITLAAFAGSFAVLLLILALSARLRSITQLLIFGIMLGYLSYSAVGFLKFFSLKDDLQRFVLWGLGSFSDVTRTQLPFYFSLVAGGLVLAFLQSKNLNLLLLGDDYARNLGLHIFRVRLWIILIAGLLTAVVTAYCGPIGFIGLAVPHLVRSALSTSDHFWLVPYTALTGAVLATGCNLIARLPVFGGVLPVNAITALMGAPIVIYVLLRSRNL